MSTRQLFALPTVIMGILLSLLTWLAVELIGVKEVNASLLTYQVENVRVRNLVYELHDNMVKSNTSTAHIISQLEAIARSNRELVAASSTDRAAIACILDTERNTVARDVCIKHTYSSN